MKRYSPVFPMSKLFLTAVIIAVLFPAALKAQQFTELTSVSLPPVSDGNAVWGDYDNDGDLDILLVTDTESNPISKLYRNNGDGTFSENTSVTLTGVRGGPIAWCDYNNDGYLDIMLAGYLNYNGDYAAKLYRNNRDGSFSEETKVSFSGIHISSTDWADFDNDGDQDILITGTQGVFPDDQIITRIYRNNGDGTFSIVSTAVLTGIEYGDAKWGDYNNDGFPDIVLAGSTGYNVPKTMVYKNNGDGTFTEQTSISLINVQYGYISWGDFNSDGYRDILLTGLAGSNPNYRQVSKVYRNNGNGTFSEQTSIQLTGVVHSTTAWGDYDNDGDPDILLTGMMPSPDDYSIPVSKIYRNDGNGNFSEQTSIKLPGVEFGSSVWGDYDNDGDMDILLTGVTRVDSSYIPISRIYKNNSTVHNTKPNAPGSLTAAVTDNKVILSWSKSTDNETLQKGLSYTLAAGTVPGGINLISPMSDRSNGYRRIVSQGNLLTNSYTLKDLVPGKYYWSVQAVDASFEGSQFAPEGSFTIEPSLLKLTSPNGGENWLAGSRHKITWTSTNVKTVKLEFTSDNGASWYTINSGIASDSGSFLWTVHYVASGLCRIRISSLLNPNVSDQSDSLFTILGQFEQASVLLPGLYNCSAAWGDCDNDGDLDLLLTGYSGTTISRIYINDGKGNFSELKSAVLTQVHSGSAAWCDYDNDGYLDILLTGNANGNPVSKIYRNSGNGSFIEQTGIVLAGVRQGSASWADYDNDGNPDILLTGLSNASYNNPISKIYRNNGNGTFTEQTNISLPAVFNSSAVWADYDNDGNIDFFLSGYTGSTSISKIFRNNGDGTFSEQTSIMLEKAANCSAAWGDYDNDGLLDILLTGYGSNGPVAKVYRNNGNGSFAEKTNIWLTGVSMGSVAWGDYDNDGYQDILLAGYSYNSFGTDPVSKVYRNNGNGTFTEQTAIQLSGIDWGTAAWGDYDNDGDLDIFLSGGDSNPVTRIYKNNINFQLQNTPPAAPDNLRAEVTGSKVTFSWNKGQDDQTPQNGLSYNIAIGTRPGSRDKLSPMADSLTGFRRIVSMGNSGKNTSAYFYLPGGTYYWSVQAVDGAYAGSKFAPERSFTVSPVDIKITSPNGGENWLAGSRQKIAWTSSNAAYLRIEFSADNGISWSPVASSIPASAGSYEWILPGLPSDQCRIKISDVTNVTDVSDSSFITTGQFSQAPIWLTGVSYGASAWGDYDNDGDLDVLITGARGNYPDYKPVSIICRNNGDGTFTEMSSISITGVTSSSVAWGDYNNDGYPDILLTGLTEGGVNAGRISKVYKNNGDGLFSEQSNISLTGVNQGSAAWGDYNNDGFQDILITGWTGISPNIIPVSKIYRNNGNGTFTEQTSVQLKGVAGKGSASWGDYNNDGFLDILLTGDTDQGSFSGIYRNDGNGGFSLQLSSEINPIPIETAGPGSSAWGDYDCDGLLDILVNGYSTRIYRNNGDGSFSELASAQLPGLHSGTAAWGDYDNDGYPDIFLTGFDSQNKPEARVYRNNGDGKFIEQVNLSLSDITDAAFTPGDFNNDGSVDILMTGNSINSHLPVTRIYKNNNFSLNTPPEMPKNLNASVNGNNVTFSWDKGTDRQTLQNGLNYNLTIGKTPGGSIVISPLSDSLTGFRRVARPGNIQGNTYTIKGLPKGTYYWSVQAIDASFWGSLFAPAKSFVVQLTDTKEKAGSSVKEYSLSQNYPNPFNPVTSIKYGLPEESSVKIVVYNPLGEMVKELVNSVQNQGMHEISFDAGNFASGIYFYSIEARTLDGSKEYKHIRKMTVLK